MIKKITFLNPTLVLVLLLVSCTTSNKNFDRYIASEYSQNEIEKDERAFLVSLGFEDYAQQAQNTLNKIESGKVASNAIAPFILKENAERFTIVKSAREVAILFRLALERSKARGQEKLFLDRMTRLTAYHLMPFALVGLHPVPQKVYNFKTGEKAKELRDQYLTQQSSLRYAQESQALYNTLVEGLYSASDLQNKSQKISANLEKIQELVEGTLKYQYEFSGLQQSRYLGRALVATLLRYTRHNGLTQYEVQLSQILEKEGQFLTNHTTSKLLFRDRKNNIVSAQVYAGDIANEYSTGPEAYQITVGVLPTTADNKKTADNLKLLSNALMLPLAFNPAIEYAMSRKKQNFPLSEDLERILSEVWSERVIRGFSHAGIADVRKDPSSGLEMVWIWDVYPYGNFGGTRFQTPENFAYPERYNRIGFVHYNSEKLLQHFQNQYKKTGYLKDVWESFGAKLTKDSEGDDDVTLDRSRRVKRASYLDKQTAEKWMSYTKEQANSWYQNEVVPRALAMAKRYLTSAEALVFSHGFKNREASSYCTQFILFAYLQGAQLDMQSTPDDWSGLVKTMTKLGLGDYEINDRIVSPSGFAWQTDLVETSSIVNFSRAPYEEQINHHPEVNGKPTVTSRRLALLSDMLNSEHIAPLKIQFDSLDLDTDDDDL